MAQVKFKYPKGLHQLLVNGDLEVKVFLNEVVFGNIDGNQNILAELKDALLSFHTADGGFPEIVALGISDILIDLNTGKGQVVFEYILGYSNTCAGTRTDISKKDRIDFILDIANNSIMFSFIELDARSTAEEF